MSAPFYLEPCQWSYGERATHRLAGSLLVSFDALTIYQRGKNGARHICARLPVKEALAYVHQHGGQNSAHDAEQCLTHLTAPRKTLINNDANNAPSRLMGILNVTPDSFSDGGHYQKSDAALAHAQTMQEEGAAIIDVGGESTRPYAEPVPPQEEIARTESIINLLAKKLTIPISIDSRNAATMRAAVSAGATIINDVSALTHDKDALSFCRDHELPIIIMHMQKDPTTMQDNPHYDDALLDVYDMLSARIMQLEAAGIERNRLILDPGIGFGKKKEHNQALLAHIALFHSLGCLLLVGVSRKRFIDDCAPQNDANQRLAGSVTAAVMMAARGVQWLRVHDVAQTNQALAVWQALVTN